MSEHWSEQRDKPRRPWTDWVMLAAVVVFILFILLAFFGSPIQVARE
jgi:hypothetical protein